MITDKEILLHLKEIQGIIGDAAGVGFNSLSGDWATRMFNTNQMTSNILKERTGHYAGKPLEEDEV